MQTTSQPGTTFVFMATDANGKRRYVEASGDSVSAARYRLEVQGFTQIEIVKDGMNAQIDAVLPTDAWEGMTLQEKIEFQRKCEGPEANRFLLWQFLKTDGLVMAGLALWVWFAAQSNRPWGRSSIVAYVCAVGFVVLMIRIRIPGRLYNRLLEARTWHRWDEVERIVARLRSVRWFTGSMVPEYELLFSEARMLAGRGDLPAALGKVHPLESDPSFAPALYYGLLGSVYDCANDSAGRVAASEKALALDPKSPTARIDLAFPLALHLRDRERARAVLQELDPADLVPMARPYLDLICGVMALDDGKNLEAESFLRNAAEAWKAFEGNPLAKSLSWLIGGYHAVALRRLGRTEEAEAKFAEARPFLEATREFSVLHRWNGR
jgi:hypothetical protein